MRNPKRELTANHYCDGKLVKSRKDRRVVYKDSKGEYIREMRGKIYIQNDTYETHSRTIRSTPLDELMENLLKKNGNVNILVLGDK